MVEFSWNDERIKRLSALYSMGISFTEIANEIGCTRNAAISKAHRSGFVPRKIAPKKPPPVVFARARKPIPGATPQPKTEPLPGKDYRCTIWQLTDSRCRFPLWSHEAVSGHDFYCGTPGCDLYASRPYCVKHTRICNPTR